MNEMRYMLGESESADWYVFPVEREKEAHMWLHLDEDMLGPEDFEKACNGDLPDWMVLISIHSLTFANPNLERCRY